MARMDIDRVLTALQHVDEWWETGKDNELVVAGNGLAFCITPVELPALTPSAWINGDGPHPFTGKMYRSDDYRVTTS